MRLSWHPIRLPPKGRYLDNQKTRRVLRAQIAFVVALVLLTAALGQRFYNAPRLDVGKAAPNTLYAPETVVVEDMRATEEKRKLARKDSASVLVPDPAANEAIVRSLERTFQQGNDIRQVAGVFPFEQTSQLSSATQSYLRKTSDESWQDIQTKALIDIPLANPGPSINLTPEQQRAIRELTNYRRIAGSARFYALLQKIAQARQNYSLAIGSPDAAAGNSPPLNAILLELSDRDWQTMQTRLREIASRMLAQGIAKGLAPDSLRQAILLNVQGQVPKSAESLAVELLSVSLQPNLHPDEEKTRLIADKAAQEIPPVTVSVRRGEVIVRGGEEITNSAFTLLDHFGMSRRGTDWFGLSGFGSLVAGAIAAYMVIERQFHTQQRQRDRLLILLLALSTPLAMLLRLPPTNLPAVGLLMGTFYGSPLGVGVPLLLAGLLPIGMTVNWTALISSALAGVVCGLMGGRLRSREELAWLGAGAGIVQGVTYLLLNLISGDVLLKLPLNTVMHSLMGLAWCVVAIGISPYLEQVFDLATTIRLVELANPNCHLLKRLSVEAPGTFQHTLFVATLAESAARALGCNVELVRTGTLYHDIGKMHDPLGFIENQMGGPNKHDEINDPWRSAEIIKKHVTEGLVMARKSRLPKAVQAFIPEHQGTMLIAYFYHQAQQRAAENPDDQSIPPVREADFRYDGPAPRSRETGIVMLADSCEAALRSLKDVSCEEALSMINKILRARWQDNQLANSGLTRDDLNKIATVFVDVWQQFNHRRIAYPKLVIAPQPQVATK